MSTVLDLVEGSLRLLQVKGSDVSLTAEEANQGMDALNKLIESYVNSPYTLYKVTRETITLPSTATSYTWGLSTSDITSEYPFRLISVQESGSVSKIAILSVDDFTTASYNHGVYLEDGWPEATLYYSGSSGDQLEVVSYKPMARYSALTDVVNLPPGYYRMLRYNLALELAPEYQVKIPADVFAIAKEALGLIMRKNHRIPTSSCDPVWHPQVGCYNIYEDAY